MCPTVYALIPPSETVGICGRKCCMLQTVLLNGNIRPGNKTSLIFFSAFKFLTDLLYFVFLVNRLYNSIVLFFKIACQHMLPYKKSNNFHPLEVVGRCSKTQLQAGENLNYLI